MAGITLLVLCFTFVSFHTVSYTWNESNISVGRRGLRIKRYENQNWLPKEFQSITIVRLNRKYFFLYKIKYKNKNKFRRKGVGHLHKPPRAFIYWTSLVTVTRVWGGGTGTDKHSFHTPDYVTRVEDLSAKGGGEVGLETTIGPGGYEIAVMAAGGAIAAVRLVHVSFFFFQER